MSLLVGPNGSGKTTLLRSLRFLSLFWERDSRVALGWLGELAYLRRLEAEVGEETSIELEVDGVVWSVRFLIEHGRVHPALGEQLRQGRELIVFREPGLTEARHGEVTHGVSDERSRARWEWDFAPADTMVGLQALVREIRVYESFNLSLVREKTTGTPADDWLSSAGTNLFTVLRNWSGARHQYRGRFDWVMAALRRAFPDEFDGLDLHTVGSAVQGSFYRPQPNATERLPMALAADGLLMGMLHLTAVAGATRGSIVAIDELENRLHPHAIRSIVKSMREHADTHDLTIVVTTHSPVVLNQFRDHEEQVFVLDPEEETLPVVLSELRDPDWLANFELGGLYEHMNFGAPRGAKELDLNT